MVIARKLFATCKQTWKKFIKGSYAYQLERKIELLKIDIKTWKKLITRGNTKC